ncbi:MAG: hypothetical protein S4CHLAM45_00750 [Chlamydiales bacterium]|nr:hypothetical protein [Chlamydiales bacterium]MCH9619396.1 hypothetical protein [Chlamydiales bacterium]MCH9622200.1 hypothetical protein [Chlamydiales bacterium]
MVGWVTFHPHLTDDEEFADLMHSSDPSSRVEAGGLVTYLQQFREGVSKEIVLHNQPIARCVIKSNASELFLFNQAGQFEAVEEFDAVHVVAADDTIDAKNACYNYNTQILTSEKTTVVHQETVIRSDEAQYDGKQIILTGNVVANSYMGDFCSDQAIVDHEKNDGKIHASKITLIGNVRMVNGEKTQYALADHVEYYPDEKMMIFESEERVLFYDKEKQMQLSAKKVRAKRDGEDEVQGYGDVHFFFGADELENLKKQFKWNS